MGIAMREEDTERGYNEGVGWRRLLQQKRIQQGVTIGKQDAGGGCNRIAGYGMGNWGCH